MKEKVEKFIAEIKAHNPETLEEIESFRVKYLGKKGLIQGLFADMRNVAAENRKEVGQVLNNLKNSAQEKYDQLKSTVGSTSATTEKFVDLTMPANFMELGSRHPLSIVRKDIIDIFARIGFHRF